MISGLKKFLKPNTLQWKIILFSITIVLVMGVAGFYLFYKESRFLDDYNHLVENILSTQQLSNLTNSNSEILQKYKATKSRNYIAQLNSNKETMNSVILGLSRSADSNRLGSELADLKNLAMSYSDIINQLIFAEESDKERYIADAEKLLSNVSASIGRVYNNLTEELRTAYKLFNANRTRTKNLAIIAFFIITLLNLISIFLFTNNLLKPINALTAAASEVSKGSFLIPSLNGKATTEEFNILTSAFIQMAESIKHYISDLNEKVDVERRLKEEEVKNERNLLLLKEAELFALQSQVNPHFMFNTLNIIAKIAYTEDANKTATIIGSMSKMLRYSLGSLKKVTTLDQEMTSLEDYIFIQKTRFADRLEYKKKLEIDISKITIPSLTIQPIVENAILHGIESKEEGGYVRIHIYTENMSVMIDIEDNGIGIPKEILDNIFSRNEKQAHKGHITGLGISNVKERLEILYGRQDLLEIFSEENRGTRVRIRLPLNENDGSMKYV
jgi:sensor histidine kinase YesM